MTFHWQRGERPDKVETMDLRLRGLSCTGSGMRLTWFLNRDDVFAVPGYLRLRAIPSKDWAQVRIQYDPTQTDRAGIEDAITLPYTNVEDFSQTDSPFIIEGHSLAPAEP
jgi:hypothetical protein